MEQAPGGSVIRAQTSHPTGRGSSDAAVTCDWLLGAKGSPDKEAGPLKPRCPFLLGGV